MSDTSNKTVSLTTFAGDYDADDFIIPSSDEKGHSVRLGFRAPPGYSRRIDVCIASKKFPYKTSSDLLRHALDRQLKWLAKQGDLDLEMTRLDLVNDLIRRERELLDFADSFRRLGDTVTELERRGAGKEAKALLMNVLKQLSEMAPNSLTTWYKDEITKRFGHLIQD